MPEVDARALNARYVKALNDRDWATLRTLFAPEYVADWPQSGERVRGIDNFRRIYEHYPQLDAELGPLSETAQVFGPGQRWAVSPVFTTIRVTSEDDRFTSVVRARYPNDEYWYVVSIFEMSDGRITRATQFFAPTYEAPEWRAAWVEPLSAEADPAG
jgi:hypothetical protein